MLSNLRHAFRQLLKSPGFTAIAVLTLALGIGLNTSMFSLMNLLVLQPLPYPDKDQLVRVFRTTPQSAQANHSAPEVREITEGARDFIALAYFRGWSYNFTPEGRPPVNLVGVRVSGDFFNVVGLRPQLGRTFLPGEDQPGNNVVVLSHAAWQAQFGGDPAIVGQSIRLDGQSVTVIGVMPDAFASVFLWGPSDIFRPFGLTEQEKQDQFAHEIALVGRFQPTDTLDQLNARLTTLATRLAPLRSEANRADSLRAVTLQSFVRNPNNLLASVMMLLLGGFVLLIACANLANLLLARAIARSHEFAVRAALGGSRSHLIIPLLMESTLVALGGGIFGMLIAAWSNDWLSAQLSANGFVKFTLVLDWRVLSFAFVISLLTGLGFGLVPALLASRINVNDTLKSGGRSTTGDRSHARFRRWLIIGQFASALVLLSAVGSFIRQVERSFYRNVGWDSSQVVMATFNLSPAKYPTPEQSYLFFTRLEERLTALPGVEKAGVGWTLPLFQYLTNRSCVVDGRDAPPAGHEPNAAFNAVTPGYFDTLGLRIIAGRNFTEADKLGGPAVVIINETMAKALFPNQDPIGQRLGSTDPANRNWMEIVGVVADNQFAVSFNAPASRNLVLKPLAQDTWNYATVGVRTANPVALAPSVRKAIESLDPDLPLQMFGPVPQVVARFTNGTMMIGAVLGLFGLLGLFLASVGLYGVIAHLVVQRTGEIGVRIALGAQARDILHLILQSGLRLTLVGTGIGLAIAYGLQQLLVHFTPQNPGDPPVPAYETPLILAGCSAVLLAAALFACWLPARRATKVNPINALRSE